MLVFPVPWFRNKHASLSDVQILGFAKHVLYLSATPIPRSLTLALFGDMEVCVCLYSEASSLVMIS